MFEGAGPSLGDQIQLPFNFTGYQPFVRVLRQPCYLGQAASQVPKFIPPHFLRIFFPAPLSFGTSDG